MEKIQGSLQPPEISGSTTEDSTKMEAAGATLLASAVSQIYLSTLNVCIYQ